MLGKEIEHQPSTQEVTILHVAELCSRMKGSISKTQQPFIGKVQKGTRSMLSSSTIMQSGTNVPVSIPWYRSDNGRNEG
jgi:hypothetical protein